MTSQQPPRFENYPPADAGPTPGAPTVEPAADPPLAITPYVPPHIATNSSAASGRRGFLGVLAAGGVGIVGLAVFGAVANSGEQGGEGPDPGSWYTEATYPDEPTDEDETVSAGDYTMTVPTGWKVVRSTGDEAIVSHGTNRLRAWGFSVDESDRALDLVSSLVNNRRDGFTGTLTPPDDLSDEDVQHARVTASGKVARKAATLTGQLWIDSDGNALLVVATVLAKAGEEITTAVEEMIEELSGDF